MPYRIVSDTPNIMNMNNKLLLTKSIALLYRESLCDDITENSSELVRSVLEDIKTVDIDIGLSTEKEIIDSLKATALTMCNNTIGYEYVKDDLLSTLKMNTSPDDKLYSSVSDLISNELNPKYIKRSIVNLRKNLTDYFKEQRVGEILTNASYMFKYKKEQIKDMKHFISEVMAQLEPLQISTTATDPAVTGDIDLGDDDSLHKLFSDIKKSNEGQNVYSTGWAALNKMLQGGFRPGLTMIGALQHKYKTGFSLTLFKQIALYNKPLTDDTDKKPLLLRISFEDDLDLNLQFLYQSLKYDETREVVNMNVDVKEMATYVKTRLQVNGFHIKLLRVNPDQWTYRSVCNKIIELEAQGYNIEVLMLDYLSKLSTEGCAQGPAGTEYLDMFSKIRNFVSPKKIACITPHQLNTEASQLIRSGIPDDQLVKRAAGGSYTQHSRQLSQIADLELYIHICKQDNNSFLSVARGKHRIPTITPEGNLYFLLQFPNNGMPIPDDDMVAGTDSSIRRLNALTTNAPAELFEF